MKRVILPFTIMALVVFSGCGKRYSSKVATKGGEMIELFTPTPNDTFSWVLVTGKASVKQSSLHVQLTGDENGMIKLHKVNLDATAPDTVFFAAGLAVPEPDEISMQKARVVVYTDLMEQNGDAALVPCFIIPGSGDAQAVILRFYGALDTNDFKTAYELLSPKGEAYPNFYQGEVIFAPRPQTPRGLEGWKQKGERLRVTAMRPTVYYNLPAEGLFCYRVWVEHTLGGQKSVQETYVFLVRQPDGSFKLYRPRREVYKRDD